MDYPITEIAMNDRFEQIEVQLDDLRHNKAGIELRDEMNYRFAENREYMKMRLDAQDQYFSQRLDAQAQQFSQRLDAQDLRFSQRMDAQDLRFAERFNAQDRRLDEHAAEMREIVRRMDVLNQTMQGFTRWVIGSQIGIVFTGIVLTLKLIHGQ